MKTVSAADLATLEPTSSVPFRLELPSGAWQCSRLLRVLRGRRVVVRARPADAEEGAPEQVLKLFIGRDHARYCARERRGLGWLTDAGLPAPALAGELQGPGLSGLALEYLPGAQPVAAEDQAALEAAAELLGRMHEAGLWQADLHLDNFILSERGLYALDGDAVRRRADAVPAGRGFEDLALLAAQRPPGEDEGAGGLLAAYAAGRSLPVPGEGEFHRKLARARRGRIQRYLKKCFRECSEFSVAETGQFRTFAVRGRGEAVLTELFERQAFSAGDDFLRMEPLKRGNSATLVRAGDSGVVIKRYNIKNMSQALRRLLRPLPRYRRSWMCGQALNLLELPTARPLALVEEKRPLLPGVAYLVMEDLGGSDLAGEVAGQGFSESRADEVAGLFVLLKRAGFTHGDTKATNFLISGGRVHLIDLDAMVQGVTGFDRDIERFFDNWDGDVRPGFEAAFRRAGLI